jgi:hypothetical protein
MRAPEIPLNPKCNSPQNAQSTRSAGGHRAGLFALRVRCCASEAMRERFRRMVEEGRANENDNCVIFRWQW